MFAGMNAHKDVVKLLIKHGADVDTKDNVRKD